MAEARPLAAPASPVRSLRWAWLALLAVLLAIAAGAALDRWLVRAPALDPTTLRAGFGPATYAEALARAEQDVAAARGALPSRPDDWVHQERLALALIERFRLAGDFADLAEADRLLDQGLAAAPEPSGPVLTKATLSVLVHRLDAPDAALARFARWAMPDADERASAAALAGDIALQRGRLAEAAAAYARAQAITPYLGYDAAVLAGQRGERDAAKRALEKLLAAPRQEPAMLAPMALQRANLAYAEGDWEDAGRWIAAAGRLFPGWWLGDAYAAQQQALEGRPAAAIRAYRALAERTGRPEVMDALAHLLRLHGQGAASRAWAARAEAGWRARAALFPEAVAHHRAEHELALGSPDRARAFAEADAAARPQAANLALLARALLLAGRPGQARAALERAARQGESAGLLMLRAEVLTALGDAAGADAARGRALAINPRAADPRTRLIWFGHD